MGTLEVSERLLSVPEVAEYLAVPVSTLYRWRSMRTGPPGMRVGRHVRYRRRDVEAWLEGRVAPEPSPAHAVDQNATVAAAAGDR